MKNYTPKIEKKSQNITSFAGIYYVNSQFINCGLGQLIDSELGSKVKTTRY